MTVATTNGKVSCIKESLRKSRLNKTEIIIAPIASRNVLFPLSFIAMAQSTALKLNNP